MKKITIETPDGAITVEGNCISSKLISATNVEHRYHIDAGLYSTKRVSTEQYKECWQIKHDFEPVWHVDANNVELSKFVTPDGKRYMLKINPA